MTENARPVTRISGAALPPLIALHWNAPASRGSWAIRENWSGTTASVVMAEAFPCEIATTGVATVPVGSAAAAALRSDVMSVAAVVMTASAPVSTRARSSRLRAPTTSASVANTVRAVATVMIAMIRRTAGRRATWTAVSPPTTRPRAVSRRAVASASGIRTWARMSP